MTSHALPLPVVAGQDWRERWMPLALAVLASLWVVLSIEPFPVGVFQDDGIYYILARSLATGEGYRYLHMPGAPNATHYPPLYPLLLAAFWKVAPDFPANVTLFKFLNAGLVALVAIVAWRFARRYVAMGEWASLLAVGAFVACTPLVMLSVMVLSEPLFLAALFPVLMLSERSARSGTSRDAIIAGVAGGVLALVRTLGAVTIPATALVLAWRRRWLAAALVCASGFVVMLPWQLWVAAHMHEVPYVLLGKYGSYLGWWVDGIQREGLGWVADNVVFNLRLLLAQGWATVSIHEMPSWIRYPASASMILLFAFGWWRLVHRAPVAAWAATMYLAFVVVWPFVPARFVFGIWPLVGIMFGLGIEAIVGWRPTVSRARLLRWGGLGVTAALVIGYVQYNIVGNNRGWWTQLQLGNAERSRHLAAWVLENTPDDAVIATDDETIIHVYTGRKTVPNGTFTPQEHMDGQTRAGATDALRAIIRAYDVDFVLTASMYGDFATRGLLAATPPELEKVADVRSGAIFRPVRGSEGQ